MLDKKAVGGLIQKQRKSKGLRQEDVAGKTGLSRTYICDIENGRYSPSLETLMRLASALEVPVVALLPVENDLAH